MTVPNVSLANLTGLKRNTEVEPAISTRGIERSGLRGEHPTGRDWKAILESESGITGTPDPYFDFDSALTYLGAFRLPFVNNGTYANSRTIQAACHRAPNGSNGSHGSIVVGGAGSIAELQIPDWNTTVVEADISPTDNTIGGIPLASVKQTYYDFIDQNWDLFDVQDSNPHIYNEGSGTWNPSVTNGARMVGWMREIDGRLAVLLYGYYRNEPTSTNLLVLDNPDDFVNTNYQGYCWLDGGDAMSGYVMTIPTEFRASFGGHDLMAGIVTGIAIVGRSSFGHSLYGFDSADINAATAATVNADQYIFFPSSNPINGFDSVNTPAREHYENVLGVDLAAYGDLPIEGRFTDLEGLPLQDPATRKHVINYNSESAFSLFVPNTDTIMHIGYQGGMRYGKSYKNIAIDLGAGGYRSGGYGLIMSTDVDNVMWAYNVNDVINRTDNQDLDYSDFKVIENWPWNGKIVAGCLDEANNLVYLIHSGYRHSAYESTHVVTVWQLNAGSKI